MGKEELIGIEPVLPLWARTRTQPVQVWRTGFPPLDMDFAKDAWVRPAAVVDYPDDVIYLEPVYFSFGYYVDISILDDTGRKVRVGHIKAALFDLHSKMYLTDVNGQVLSHEYV